MTVKLQFGVDSSGKSALSPFPTDVAYSADLVNNTPATITVPASAKEWTVAFSITPGTEVWVDFSGATAAAPAGATFAATTSVLNPKTRTISSSKVPTISVLTTDASSSVSVEFFAAGNNNVLQ